MVTSAGALHSAFASAFNAQRREELEDLFEPDAVLVIHPGETASGDARRRATGAFLDLGLPIQLRPRQAYVCGDPALLISDHLIAGTSSDGQPVGIEGTSTTSRGAARTKTGGS